MYKLHLYRTIPIVQNMSSFEITCVKRPAPSMSPIKFSSPLFLHNGHQYTFLFPFLKLTF